MESHTAEDATTHDDPVVAPKKSIGHVKGGKWIVSLLIASGAIFSLSSAYRSDIDAAIHSTRPAATTSHDSIKPTLAGFVRNGTLYCVLGDGKTFAIHHYPDGNASIISNGIEMRAHFDIYDSEELRASDYDIYKIRDMSDSSREYSINRNMGFYVLSINENSLEFRTTHGGGHGRCTREL
jgi:hypothetical protein